MRACAQIAIDHWTVIDRSLNALYNPGKNPNTLIGAVVSSLRKP